MSHSSVEAWEGGVADSRRTDLDFLPASPPWHHNTSRIFDVPSAIAFHSPRSRSASSTFVSSDIKPPQALKPSSNPPQTLLKTLL